MIQSFDHVNIRTGQLEAMIAWYGEFLGLHPGDRPDFPFPGAWLYLDDAALVHLIEVSGAPRAGDNLTLEHMAFRATGFQAFKDKLTAKGIAFEIIDTPVLPVIQINIWDPDGNHIHVDFDRAETH